MRLSFVDRSMLPPVILLLMSVQLPDEVQSSIPSPPPVARRPPQQPGPPSCRYLVGFLPALSLSKGQFCVFCQIDSKEYTKIEGILVILKFTASPTAAV